MKNFSVNTADFDSLSISGESPIVQSDLGTAPNQIPLNKDLGSLAYMNAPQIEDLNVDTLELREIAAELSDTAVDVFVYDTRKDSDGGAWRERTSHTSWYNEPLNTATRGGRREFPAVAVIVAEANKVTIYDGDDPDLPMWMVFIGEDNKWSHFGYSTTNRNCKSIYAVNGIVSTCGASTYIAQANFVADNGYFWATANSGYLSSISSRENVTSTIKSTDDYIINSICNDVAMTVLPNAPIDSETGLPIPTIAVATDGGYSIIKDDGTVVDGISSQSNHNKVEKITFTDNNQVAYIGFDYNLQDRGRFIRVDDLISADTTITTSIDQSQNSNALYGNSGSGITGDVLVLNIPTSNYIGESFIEGKDGNIMFGNVQNLFLIDENRSSPSKGMHAGISTDFNTGWMPGDIKLATLSDTKNETVGVDESTELLVDGSGNWIGDFDVASDLDSWTVSNGGIKSLNVSVIKVVSGTNGDRGSVWSMIDTIPGKKYSISTQLVTAAGNGSGFISVYEGNGTSGSEITTTYPNTFTSGSYIYLQFTAQSEQSTIRLSGSEVLNDFTEWDNISIKQTGELITNGTFDDGIEGWNDVSGGVGSYDNGALKITKNINDSLGGVDRAVSGLIEGKRYIFTADIIAVDQATGRIGVGSISNNTGIANIENLGIGSHSVNFVANQSTMYFVLYASGATETGGQSVTYDNISVRLAEDDRSVNDNGLQIFGQIDKTPVAPGADLVAYSGFSADNYLVQPYNADLDFGTGDFLSTWWIYRNDTLAGSVFHRSSALVTGNTATSDAILQAEFGASQFQAQVYTNGFSLPSDNSTLTYTGVPSGVWTHMAMSRKSNVLSLYVNGKFIDSVQSDATVTNTNAPMSIGTRAIRSGLERPLNGSLALLRFSATAPTPDQIAKIYRDEKVLFQDGAQATLYGTSDAVTALAYDDSENLLHVGTASGRSSFNGLKRVDNTTTAVSTAISATEGLVIEQ
jgi:hypothetical protein